LDIENSPLFRTWLTALEARYLADLRIAEVTRALRALSSAYVERRGDAIHRALDSAGKRAAFALFYAPLHFLTTERIVRGVNAHVPQPRLVLDVGCGTGAAGAAWAVAANGARVLGIDRHPWAVAEAKWTYTQLDLVGQARRGNIAHPPEIPPGTAIIAAYVLNELAPVARESLQRWLVDAAGRGRRVLVIEPIARRLMPWWPSAESQLRAAAGARVDEWRFPMDLPPWLHLLDRAAGMNHSELTARSIYCPGDPRT
jgi:SAM-dependent methyltransferase